MFINALTKLKFLANQDSSVDMTPQVLSLMQEKDRDGDTREVLTLKFFCRVDAKILSSSPCSKIDVKLSNFDLSFYRSKSSQTQTKVVISNSQKKEGTVNYSDNKDVQSELSNEQFTNNRKNKRRKNRQRKNSLKLNKQPLNSKVSLAPKNLTAAARGGSTFKLVKNQNLFSGTKSIGSISVSPAIQTQLVTKLTSRVRSSTSKNTSTFLNNYETVLEIEKQDITGNKQNNIGYNALLPISFRAFKKQYNNLIHSSIDPITLFESPLGKSSYLQQKQGIIPPNQQKKPAASKVIKEIQRQIASISKSRYVFKKTKTPIRYRLLEITSKISMKDLKALGPKCNVIFIAKDRNGINLESQNIVFKVDDLLRQTIKQSTKMTSSVSRKPNGVTKLVVGNLERNSLLDVDVDVKKVTRQENFLETYYADMLGTQKIPPSSTLTIVDGSVNANPRSPVNFKASESLFFRTTINYRGKKYGNANGASIKGVKGSKKNNNIPNLNIVARIDEGSAGISVDITKISSNIVAVKLRKYRYTGSSKGKLLETYDSNQKINDFVFLSNDAAKKQSIKFLDSDVFDSRVYMYVAECIMKNGERKLATDYFIEKYEKKTETVKIENVDVTTEDLIVDASANLNEERLATRTVKLDFKISKIETEIDKIIKNLFGNLFDIYKEELTKIKDTQGLIYSIEVQRIEVDTGDAVTVNKITADELGNCTFTDTTAPAFSNLIYKLIPRVQPANEIIAAVVAQTPHLAKNTIAQPINYVSAAARISAKNRNEKVYTSKNNKYINKQVFKKGRVRPAKDILSQNSSDLFADASTGDVAYIDVTGLNGNQFTDSINISAGMIKEIKHMSGLSLNNSSNDKIVTRYFELEYNVNNDYLVDFYAVFIKEGQRVYLDGAIHSTDTLNSEKRYSYLVKHEGSIGVVEYYIVPIYKNGNVLSPKLVTAQLI